MARASKAMNEATHIFTTSVTPQKLWLKVLVILTFIQKTTFDALLAKALEKAI